VIDLAMATGDSGEAVEVFWLNGDIQLAPNLGPLWRRRTRDIAGNVVLHDRPVETADGQRTVLAGGLRRGQECQLTTPFRSGRTCGQRLLEKLILEDVG
jgi:hypothetical protein